MKKIYLDHAATTPIDPVVYDEMLPYFKTFYGNPSSIHKEGIVVKKSIQDAKKKIASLLNAKNDEIFFTSGGTEAINWAIKGYAQAHINKKQIITTQIEHHATLHTCRSMEALGYEILYLPVDSQGFISINDLEKTISRKTLMVSIIWGNNEIGTIQKIDKIIEVCQKHQVILHVDAVQIFGQAKIDLEKMKIDLLSLSAHKFYGPKGIGLLYIRTGLEIKPYIDGGNQQSAMRAGTENVYGMVGFSKAAEVISNRLESYTKHIDMLAKALYTKIKEFIPEVRLNGPEVGEYRLLGHLSLSFPNCSSHDLAFALDAVNIFVSTGSACTSSLISNSHVLEAIHLPKHYATIRITFGIDNELIDIDYIVEKILSCYQSVRK